MGVCLVEFFFLEKEAGQVEMKVTQVASTGGSDSKGRLEMANGLIFLFPALIYMAKNLMKAAEKEFLTFLRDEIDSAGCDVLCSVKLVVSDTQPGEVIKTPCLFFDIADPFENFQSFLRLLNPFFVEI